VSLLRADVPIPAPQVPFEDILAALSAFYVDLSAQLSRFIPGLTAMPLI
jgi:hypothetical protein